MTGGRRPLLFDFGGTLDADGVPWSARFWEAYRALGGALGEDAFEAAFRESDRRLSALPDIATTGLRRMIEEQAAQLADLVPDLPARRARELAQAFHRATMSTIDRNRGLLDRLAATHRLGIVSNFCGNLRACLDEIGLRAAFAAVVDSGVVGVAKPDARIFAIALEALDAPAEGTWMIGDNPEADVRPAARLGMKTCWLAPAHREAPRDPSPTRRIHRLLDLDTILERA